MKEKPDTRTDPVLEECYRMKEAFAAKFNTAQELHDYLKANQKKWKALGFKYAPLPPPRANEDSNKKQPDIQSDNILLALIFSMWYPMKYKGKIAYVSNRTHIN